MTKELRRLSIVMLVMFLALFGSTSYIQAIGANELHENPHNRRALYDSFEVQRGAILAGESVIATSVPSGDLYSWQRQYTDALMWAPVTGYINPVLTSATGLEQAMNSVLSGTAATQLLARLERVISGQPPRGANVVLTLDPAVQAAAFEALGDYEGAIIATTPTGEVLAMVTSPSFDTNLLASHDTVAVDEAYQQLVDDPLDPLFNRAIGGDLNPPGSTFKLVVAATALASGRYTPQSTFPNPTSWQLPGSTSLVYNHDNGPCGPGETVTLADALRLSCNIPFAELAVALGDDEIRAQAELFGFNTSFDLPVSSTASVYPPTADDAFTALSGFGQGDVLATPLQIGMVSAAIANRGVLMNPRMVDLVAAPDLSWQEQYESTQFAEAIDAKVAAQLAAMMVDNVSNGAASGARIEGVDVAGKTGTAEHGPDDPYTVWFTGFAPADTPEVVVTVMIENGGGMGQQATGNEIAAPIAKRVIEAVLSR
ncbi:peptidoglycan D,D-transpeptidase FtsI family protein [Microbacterium sp. No. 7]|uniref:peptidoglycan D,D-transpeptidase FtsI family protein n=1 Tax=Microbacterium sp. No. 7 TaxID=1714373 RepID=UPI0006D0577E|nr:penicillin-binding transpeptidase domain-containing protein [Microbacterium sp. No. 7]ALJ18477.1 cell division protein FtsI [Microbacterium sp. No. 7]